MRAIVSDIAGSDSVVGRRRRRRHRWRALFEKILCRRRIFEMTDARRV